ncbi:hypothetical protein Tsubulata_048937 [Turnera subulata]|uniref:Uncharacterized protein n=1 Tax=Turnera subulata TaxID=218843 RepID=A0A9Q0FDW0_9ROSI|nr:hypothetical protein Tsubulata_048937 [Turnera subulata]
MEGPPQFITVHYRSGGASTSCKDNGGTSTSSASTNTPAIKGIAWVREKYRETYTETVESRERGFRLWRLGSWSNKP